MQQRLRRFLEDRTQMLAAISHDLRAPLARLRLRAELVEDDEQQRKMFGDLTRKIGEIGRIQEWRRRNSENRLRSIRRL